MKHSKVHKVIALWNSYNSLEGSDFTEDKDIQKAMQYCKDEIVRLGYDVNQIPCDMEKMKVYLKAHR